MNCLESRELLQQQLDGQPIDRAALREHLVSCAECAALHAAAGRLQEGLRLLAAPLLPAGMRERVLFKILAEQCARRRRRRMLAGAALAASLLVALAAGFYALRPAEPTIPAGALLSAAEHLPPAPPTFRESVAEAGTAVVSLTLRKADETVGQTRMFWPALTPPSLDNAEVLSEPLEPPARSLREAGQNLSAGLEPVASSARRAVGMFLRELPPMGDDSP
jgi:anti-sigma factor RsiW